MTLYSKIIKLHFKNGVTIRELSEVFRDELKDYIEFGFKLSNLEKVQMIVCNEIVQIEKLRQETEIEEIETMTKRDVAVINEATGIIYNTITEAAIKEKIVLITLQKKLSGQRTNNTNLRIYNPCTP